MIAAKHGGVTAVEHLAYACAQCNRFKGSDIATFDPQTGQVVPLCNPHTQRWFERFRLDSAIIVTLSPTRRTTERLLQLHLIDRILLRNALRSAGRYPLGGAIGSVHAQANEHQWSGVGWLWQSYEALGTNVATRC